MTTARQLTRRKLLASSAITSGTVQVPSPDALATARTAAKEETPEVKLAGFLLNRFIDQGTPNFHLAEKLGTTDHFYTLEIPFTLLDQHRWKVDEETVGRASSLLCNVIVEQLGKKSGPGVVLSATMTKGSYDGEDKSYLMLGIPEQVALSTNMPATSISETFQAMLKSNRSTIAAQLPIYYALEQQGNVTYAGRS